MPKRPIQHEIDELAQRAFRDALPPSWIVNPFTNDYAKDFNVEVVDAGDVTGEIFFVQLKGKLAKRKRAGAEYFSVPIRFDHLRYYCDLVPIPVFIVAVDVATGDAYFEFAQRLALEDPSIRERLHDKGNATLRIRRENNLKDTARILQELTAALEFLRSRNPGTVEAAVAYRRADLKKLDPRFEYDISVRDGKQSVKLSATTPVQCQFVLEGDSETARKKLQAFIDEGTPLETGGGITIRVKGSPLFENETFAKIEYTNSVPIEVRLYVKSETQATYYFPDFRGSLAGGVRKLFFSGLLPGAPLEIGIVLEHVEGQGIKFGLNWRWLPEKWAGQPVRELSWFEPIHSFFVSIAQHGAAMGIELSSNGKMLVRQTLPREQLGKMPTIKGYIDLLKMARHVCDVLQLDGKVPMKWKDVDFQDVDEVYALVTTGRYEFAGKVEFSATLSGVPEKLMEEFNADPTGVFGLSPKSPHPYTFLGTSFDFADVKHEFADVEQATLKRVPGKGGDLHRLKLEGATRRYVWPRFLNGDGQGISQPIEQLEVRTGKGEAAED